MVNTQNLKGFRDFLPKEVRIREYVLNTLKEVFTSYGFEPLETPSLEYEEVLRGKYGDEGEKMMYKFKDLGDRDVAMRYDQTVPLARVISQYQNEIPLPFKRYQTQNVWRAENTQRGRFREFLQVDFDTVGSHSPSADGEIIAVISRSLDKLGLIDYKILINDRKVFEGIDEKAVIIIDKLSKIGEEEVVKELEEKGFKSDILNKIKETKITDSLSEVLEIAKKMGVETNKISFDPTLARGLNYYTGIIIEVTVDGYSGGSIGGGGRYDNLIGIFAGKEIPAVGFAFGFDRLIEVLGEKNLFPDEKTNKIFIAISGLSNADKAMEAANAFREKGIEAETWLDTDSPIDKQMKYADKKNFPFVLKINDKLTFRNMSTGQETELTIDQIVNELIKT